MADDPGPFTPYDVRLMLDAVLTATLASMLLGTQEQHKTMALTAHQAANSALQQQAAASTLDLAVTASGAQQILSPPPPPPPQVRRKTVTAVDLHPGAPVVT